MTYTEEQYNEVLRVTAAEIQSLKQERDRLAVLLAAASAAFETGDMAALTKIREAALKTEKEKALEAALAEKAAAEAKIAELSAEL